MCGTLIKLFLVHLSQLWPMFTSRRRHRGSSLSSYSYQNSSCLRKVQLDHLNVDLDTDSAIISVLL